MCGILGIINPQNQPVPIAELSSGLARLRHRGPDGQGVFQGPNFSLGHRRLAVFDLSEQGRQPMAYRGRVIVFNGAVYNFPELKAELQTLGHHFRSQTDTEVIVAAYTEWGAACVRRFNGQWAFAIYDPDREQLFCSRDRFGIKPFYYAEFGGRFHFASEIKAFTDQPGWQPALNQVRAYEFLAYGLHDHTAQTLYRDVQQLPQGSNLTYDLRTHQFQIERYYELRQELTEGAPSFSQAKDDFYALLQDAVRLRLRADVAVGSALSGGLDSSSVVSLIKTLPGGENLTTISVCFPAYPAIDESNYIDALQERIGFTSLRISPDAREFQQEEELVGRHQDEPLTGAGAIAQFLLFRKARQAGITVMLDGQGADEVLGGYEKFYAPYFRTLLRRRPAALFPALWNFISLHHWSYSRIFDKAKALNIKTRGLIPAWIHPDFLPEPDALYRPPAFHTVQELSLQLIGSMGLPALLHYEDRNAMAHGIESRLPFLDHRLVAFCLSQPDDYKIRQGRRKTILREALQELLPPAIYHRYDKLGFAVPEWTPSAQQLQESALVLQGSQIPILQKHIDWTKLPTGTQQRIYYFAQFLKGI